MGQNVTTQDTYMTTPEYQLLSINTLSVPLCRQPNSFSFLGKHAIINCCDHSQLSMLCINTYFPSSCLATPGIHFSTSLPPTLIFSDDLSHTISIKIYLLSFCI
jgi:hypothetical protein